MTCSWIESFNLVVGFFSLSSFCSFFHDVRCSFVSRFEPFDFMNIKVIGIDFMLWLEKEEEGKKRDWNRQKNHPPCRSRNKRYSHHMILSSQSGISMPFFFLSTFTFHRCDCIRLHGSFCAILVSRDHRWATIWFSQNESYPTNDEKKNWKEKNITGFTSLFILFLQCTDHLEKRNKCDFFFFLSLFFCCSHRCTSTSKEPL